MKIIYQSLLPIVLMSYSVFAEDTTIILQNGLDNYTGCQDRSLFEKKLRSDESKWAGSMAGTFPEMNVHNIEANDGECEKLAFGQLIC